MGATGEAWRAGLPGLLAGLATDWSITVGARLDGGRASYVAEATTHDGTPAVLKVSIPPGIDEFTPFDRQLAVLRLAGGDPYVGLIRHDVPRQALLLERLCRPMAGLGWPAARQLEALARTAARGWRPVPDHDGLPTGAEAARWHAAFVSSMWEDLAQPCSRAAVDLAVADKLAAATAKAKPDQERQGGQVTPARVTGEGRPTRRPSPGPDEVPPCAARLLLMVGLPGAGKTTRARELAAAHRALRLTPDEWMISLFGAPKANGKRDVLEGRLIAVALQALQVGTNVVLDFGLWGRDERSALRWLATSAGASCLVIYLPVDKDVQRARIAHRQATAPHTTFPMTEADIDKWREQFQAPDAAELSDGETIPEPPPGWPGWPEWAAHRWPSLDPARPST
jgi:predicted kinase